jgi:hypothetical protein
MKKKLILGSVLMAVAALFFHYTLFQPVKSPLKVETKHGASGLSDYFIIYKKSAKIEFENTRPLKEDTNILLCIPGAFTRLNDYAIDGLYICKGKVINKNAINHSLGGGIKIEDGKCTIFSTGYGKRLTDSIVNVISAKKGYFFQQIRMIDDEGPAHFKDSVLTYRRGIAIFKNGEVAIIESSAPVMLSTFANDIYKMDAQSLIYTDMGSWDEGWYRNPSDGGLVVIGKSRTETKLQSNWVIFRK